MSDKIIKLFKEPTCRFCNKPASEILEYSGMIDENGKEIPSEEFVKYDGTYNSETDTFICTDCYIERGCPVNE